MNEAIGLKELLNLLKKRLWLILLISITAGTVSGVISYFVITPVYEGTTQILVNRDQAGENFTTNEVQTNIQLIDTYRVIITSPRILNIVAEELNSEISVDDLEKKIEVQSESNSQVMNVSVEDNDPNQAVHIANTIAEVFQKEVPALMNVDNISVLTFADVSDAALPVKPKPILNIALAFGIGLLAGIGLVFLLDVLDTSVKTEQDIENILDIPVLGVITTFGKLPKVKSTDVSVRAAKGENRVHAKV